jgi:hypothetical protein
LWETCFKLFEAAALIIGRKNRQPDIKIGISSAFSAKLPEATGLRKMMTKQTEDIFVFVGARIQIVDK